MHFYCKEISKEEFHKLEKVNQLCESCFVDRAPPDQRGLSAEEYGVEILGILRVPRTATRLMRTGPVRERAEQLLELFRSPTTSLAIIGLPEEMVVNETLELWEKIRDQVPELQRPKVFLNRSSSPSLTDD